MRSEIRRLREEIAALDGDLTELLGRRFSLAAEVGRIKAASEQPVVVREVEQRVVARARGAAERCGVSAEVMESIFAAVIRGSVERQHRVGVEQGARGGTRVLVVGAAGAMGGWLCRFLEGIGHAPEGVDTAWTTADPEAGRYPELAAVPDLDRYDAAFVSVPLEATAELLAALAGRGATLPIFEITSIKSHLQSALSELRGGGAEVISLHPMFGPRKGVYEPLTIVHAVGRDEESERRLILDLLAHPYLDLISLPFERHDRLMGWLLGLAHLTGMLFAEALAHSGLDPRELQRASSTTFARQVATARSVLDEDPDLYFAIQRLNPFRGEVYAALTAALGELTGAVERDRPTAFRAVLERAASALPHVAK